eukprot:2893464-Pleurochrysis_carterae.AAC.1
MAADAPDSPIERAKSSTISEGDIAERKKPSLCACPRRAGCCGGDGGAGGGGSSGNGGDGGGGGSGGREGGSGE